MAASTFQRIFLPGFAFKAVVIGGGYATGRELAEFFLPSGPWGGVLGMILAMFLWSVIAAITFLFARFTGSKEYGTFFRALLGRASVLFDIAYFAAVFLMLSVYGAAAGAIGASLLGWPELAGCLILIAGIASVAAFSHESVERLFKYVTILLYGVYALFLCLALSRFSPEIQASFGHYAPLPGWAAGGLAYTGYNIIGAVVVLPVLRHLRSDRDAVVAGVLCGPLGMLPAIAFFVAIAAFYPSIEGAELPSDFLLSRLNAPTFRVLFQFMIFAALLESGTGVVHAVNERVANVLHNHGRRLSSAARCALSLGLLVAAIFVARRFGLISLIARGYRAFSFVFLAIYVAPLLTFGVWQLLRRRSSAKAAANPAPTN
jgi:uncharacterized membrane protein YkvI